MKILKRIASVFTGKDKEEADKFLPIEGTAVESASAVIVGMEYSKRFGSCPGSARDAENMREILKGYVPDINFIPYDKATKRTVVNALKKAVESDFCIFCYSGHGGSETFSDTGPEEIDKKDEFLCLYDTYLRDNEIWKILEEAKGRVFLYFDCCHSSDMFRVQNPFALGYSGVTSRDPKGKTLYVANDKVNALVWAGCHESTVSWGSAAGGELTNCLKRHFDKTKSYDNLWEDIATDKQLLKAQIPYRVIIGNNDFGSNYIFT